MGIVFKDKVDPSRVTRQAGRMEEVTRPQTTTTSPNDVPESLTTPSPKGPGFETRVTPSRATTQPRWTNQTTR